MSYFYQYDFVSPEPIYANVKEELKSYFDTGAVDDLMFPTWTDKCLRKIGKSAYDIVPTIIHIEDFTARLPDNFYKEREVWLCTQVSGFPYQQANSFYSQAASQSTIQVSPVISNQQACNGSCPPDNCTCMPELIQAVYKTNNELNHTFRKEYLLKPANVTPRHESNLYCGNVGSNAPDSYDIRDNKLVTNFRTGCIYLIFYAKQTDSSGYQLVPDNYRIMEYIEAFIKYKVFEMLFNQIVDETFNQIQAKYQLYKQQSDEAYILADTEIKKQTAYAKQRVIISQRNSLNMYQLPDRNYRYGWRRNQ